MVDTVSSEGGVTAIGTLGASALAGVVSAALGAAVVLHGVLVGPAMLLLWTLPLGVVSCDPEISISSSSEELSSSLPSHVKMQAMFEIMPDEPHSLQSLTE